MSNVQVIIVGQGFAGTALAWTLVSHGINFVVVDSGTPQTSSRIAAGLVTPITGKRAVKTWEWDNAWNCAQSYYRQLERRINASFWNEQPSLRLFDSDEERTRIEAQELNHPEWVTLYHPSVTADQPFDQSFGGILMNVAARLDGSTYLEASRDAFKHRNAYCQHSLDLKNDIHVHKASVDIPTLGIRADRLVFCQGYWPEVNPWFSSLPLVPAQGDILTVDIPNFAERRTIHRNVWLTPVCNHSKLTPSSHYLVGSTYRWQGLDGLPSLEARQEILSKLSNWLHRPVKIIDHRSAVRPTSFDQKPLIGPSPVDSRLWVFNGLGAKGTLMAPWCAEQLVEAMFGRHEIRPPLFWDRRRR